MAGLRKNKFCFFFKPAIVQSRQITTAFGFGPVA